MAPKKGEPPPVILKEDRRPYGVFVRVEVPSAVVPLDSSGLTNDEAGDTIAPKLHLVLSYPGENLAPLSGEPTSGTSDGLYNLNFDRKFRREGSQEALHTLLNSPTTLGLHDSANGNLLASVQLDLLAFGLGDQTVSFTNLTLAIHSQPRPSPPPSPPPATTKAAAKEAKEAAAAQPPTPPVALTGPVTLPTVTVSLLQRERPAEGTAEAAVAAAALVAAGIASDGEVSTPSGSKPATPSAGSSRPATRGGAAQADPVATTAVVLDESALPPLQPFRYLPDGEDDPAKLNVVELHLWGPAGAAVPPGLLAAADAAGGKLSLAGGLALPAPGPALTIAGGAVVKDSMIDRPPLQPAALDASDLSGPSIVWPGGGRVRRVFTQAASAALLALLDNDPHALGIEVVRYMGEDKALGDSPAVAAAYHGWAPLTGADALLEAAQTCVPEEASDEAATTADPTSPRQGQALRPHTWAALGPWPEGRKSALPAQPQPPGKFKPIEDIPPAVLASTGQGGYSAWQASGAGLAARLQFARPLVPPWSPPPPPPAQLTVLVPPRDLNPPPPPTTPEQDMQTQVASLLHELAAVYKREGGAQALLGTNSDPARRFRLLVRALNTSGAYMSLRDKLKAPLLRLATEKLGASGSMAASEMNSKYAELYSRLAESAHAALNAASDARPAPPLEPEPISSPKDLERLRERAAEAEAVGDMRRARALLARRRRADPDCVDAHLDVAAFEARAGASSLRLSSASAPSQPAQVPARLVATLSAVKAALEVDPGHPQALLLLGCLCLESLTRGAVASQEHEGGGAEDGIPQGQALSLGIAAGHALLDVTSGASLAWALLSQLYEAGGMAGEARSCTQELRRRERAAIKGVQQQSMQETAQPAGQVQGEHDGEAAAGASTPDDVQQPWEAAGALALWSACLELCLPCAAARAQAAALTTFRRSTGSLPHQVSSALTAAGATCSPVSTAAAAGSTQLEVLLLTARTALLLGCSDPAFARAAAATVPPKPVISDQQQSVEQDGSTAADGGASTSPQHANTWLGLADVALRMARRVLDSQPASQGRKDVRPFLLTGDLALARAEQESQAAGVSQEPAAGRQARLAAARSAYQAALQAVAASMSETAEGAGRLQTAPPPSSAAEALAGAAEPAANVPWLQLLRGGLSCASSYLVDADLPEAAGNVYSTVANLWPRCTAAWAGAAQAAMQAGGKPWSNGMVASAALHEANLLDPLDGEVWAQLAHASFREGRTSDGLAALERALSMHALVMENPVTSTAKAPLDPAALLQEAAWRASSAGDTSAAVGHLQRALAVGTPTFTVHQQLARALAARGDLVSAREHACAAGRMAGSPLDQQLLQELDSLIQGY